MYSNGQLEGSEAATKTISAEEVVPVGTAIQDEVAKETERAFNETEWLNTFQSTIWVAGGSSQWALDELAFDPSV